MKPKIFIGSSVEGIEIARAIQENLDFDALCNIWDQGIFELPKSSLENLIDATESFDYAIFVFQPDDVTKIREGEFLTVRDNLIFELGLFISKIGKDNVFFVIPRGIEKLHIPTDLLGIQPGHYEVPEDKKDLLASLGPFCNKVRRQIKEGIKVEEKVNESIEIEETIKSVLEVKNEDQYRTVEYGVSVDEFGNYTISVAPTVFFSHRMAKAFPGTRGLKWFDDPEQALDRLELLLRSPLKFEKAIGYGVTDGPIWWSRGFSDLEIPSFRRLSATKCLMDVEELNINRIATYHSDRYWQSFVYVEVNPDKPIGLYNYPAGHLEEWLKDHGYYHEEYGLFDNVPITRTCFDDGAAEIDGKITDTSGAELRLRYLTKYNFIIASRYSPINNQSFEKYSEKAMNEMLNGNTTIEQIIEFIKKLPRHDKDD